EMVHAGTGGIILDEEESGSIATTFGISTSWQRPICLRILAKIRWDKEGIFVAIGSHVAAILEHGEAHIQVIRPRFVELHLVRHFVRVLGENRFRVKRRPARCSAVRTKNEASEETRNTAAFVD